MDILDLQEPWVQAAVLEKMRPDRSSGLNKGAEMSVQAVRGFSDACWSSGCDQSWSLVLLWRQRWRWDRAGREGLGTAQTTSRWPRKKATRHGVQMSLGPSGNLLGPAESL